MGMVHGGNAMTRIGVVVLFFGIAFLLRYFAEHFTLPIEFRLAAVAAFGFALIALGLRLAASRPGYGLSLQGAGAGILYLTTFAAFRLYGVLPARRPSPARRRVGADGLACGARRFAALAGLAIAGGFLAPCWSTPAAAPSALQIFRRAERRDFRAGLGAAWRALNAVGFVFTFVLARLGTGLLRPEHYAVASRS